ncbi:MAG: hypothetical protein LBK59_09145 [Bifidobacteriaceae bacterium]|jgi:hypothetical protein|nr:hypothetical protein [Bifidobacteriaceae bacterium]
MAALPAAYAAPTDAITIYGGGGGGGGGSRGGTASNYPVGLGGTGGTSGQFNETAASASPGTAGEAGTTREGYPDEPGTDGPGGNGSSGIVRIGSSQDSIEPGQAGPARISGGAGGAATHIYTNTAQPETFASLSAIAGDGGNGGGASIVAGGPGGNGGGAIARFRRQDTSPSAGYFPLALLVNGDILVRSGHRGQAGASSERTTGPDEEGGAGGFGGDATLEVRGTLQADSLTVVKRDGPVKVDITKLLVEEGDTTTIVVDGTSNTPPPADVAIDNIEVEDGGTLIIDDSRGQLQVDDSFVVQPGGTVIITDPDGIEGGAAPTWTLDARTSLPALLRLPASGGSFTLPLTGTGLATAEVKALRPDGQPLDIATSEDPERTATAAYLPVAFPANSSTAARSYTLVVGDGSGIWVPLNNFVVEVVGTGGSSQPLPFTIAPTPVMTGTPEVGSTLVADPGDWVPSPDITYQWLRDGQPIPGATSNTYTITEDDAGSTVSVRTTATGDGMATTNRDSAGLSIPAGNNGNGNGNGGDDNGGGGNNNGGGGNGGDGNNGNNGNNGNDGAPGVTGTPSPAPLQDPTLPAGISWISTQVVTPEGLATVFLGIAGTARVGKVFTARIVTASTAQIAYTYQWLRAGKAIKGATKATYTLVSADRNKRVAVRLTAAAPASPAATVTSASKAIKIGVMKTTRPKITGTVRVGRTLKANASKWTAGAKKKYQWYRGSKKIKGATKAKYVAKAADRGKRLTVKVKGTKAGYKAVSRASASRLIR